MSGVANASGGNGIGIKYLRKHLIKIVINSSNEHVIAD